MFRHTLFQFRARRREGERGENGSGEQRSAFHLTVGILPSVAGQAAAWNFPEIPHSSSPCPGAPAVKLGKAGVRACQ